MGVAVRAQREAPVESGHQGGDLCPHTAREERSVQFRPPVCRGQCGSTLPLALGRPQPLLAGRARHGTHCLCPQAFP